MFSQIKNIMIQKCNKQLEQLKQKEDRLQELESSASSYEFSLVPMQKFNIFQKVFKTKSYRQYLKTMQLAKETREKKKKEEAIEKEELLQGKEERTKKIEEILAEYEKVMNAQNLKDLEIDFDKAINILNQEQIPIILEPNDNLDNPKRDYKGLEDFVFVHRTDRTVKNNRLTTEAEDSKRKQNIEFNGKKYEYQASSKKDTLQFFVNNEIQLESWQNSKYTVVIPLADIPREIIGGVSPGDAYTMGGVSLTKNCYILCGEENAEELRRQNPKLALKNIISCKGNLTRNYSQILLKLLGYKVEQPDDEIDYDGWKDKNAETRLRQIVEENGLEYGGYIEKGIEKDSSNMKINAMVGIYQCIKENSLATNEKEGASILKQMQTMFPDYNKEDYKILDILYKKLAETGIQIEQSEQQYFHEIVGIQELDEMLSFVQNNKDIPDNMKEFITTMCDEQKENEKKTNESKDFNIQKVKNSILNKIIIDNIGKSRECKSIEVIL